jgi:hypothetical protein
MKRKLITVTLVLGNNNNNAASKCYYGTEYVTQTQYETTYGQQCSTTYEEKCEREYETSCKTQYEYVRQAENFQQLKTLYQ